MEPFFTTKELGKGSGLGLPMVYGFAKQSNGAFRIRSEFGQGTTAELLLPRAPEGEAVAIAPPKDEPRAKSTRKLRILLVDDHFEVRSTTAAVLDRHWTRGGRGCATAPRPSSVLKEGDCSYDVMISDYAMPHLSGTEFLRSAREICPDVPASDHHRIRGSGFHQDRPDGVEILLKPFTANKLEVGPHADLRRAGNRRRRIAQPAGSVRRASRPPRSSLSSNVTRPP